MKCCAALRTRIADAAGGNSVGALSTLNGASVNFYTGSVPSDADASPTGTLLGTVLMNATDAFGAASDTGTYAEVTAAAITGDAAADATGTATYARLVLSDSTRYAQLTVGASGSGADIELSTTSIVTGGPINITSFALRALEG